MKTIHFFALILIAASTFSCTNFLGVGTDDERPLTQFADGIIEFSSEYSAAPGPWSSFVVLGAPDTYPLYCDIQTAWASKTADGQNEFLTLAFDTAQYVNNISIYETYNPGAVIAVFVRNSQNGSWVPVYSGQVERGLKKEARIKEVIFPQTTFLVDAVKINIASRSISGWNEIDAVSISGYVED